MVLVALMLLAASPLDTARAHLAAGQLDDVLFAVEGVTFASAEQPKAAALLGEAALAAWNKSDDLLALQFSQRALKLQPGQLSALEAAARSNFRQQEFAPAERFADAWVKAAPKSAAARLLRAQLAEAAGEWALVLEHLGKARFDGGAATAAKALRGKAERELEDSGAARTAVKSMEERLAEAARAPVPSGQRTAAVPVVVYSQEGCGFCVRAMQYLTSLQVPFTVRDVGSDEAARDELMRKKAAVGLRTGGVPVIDVGGILVQGFAPDRIDKALREASAR